MRAKRIGLLVKKFVGVVLSLVLGSGFALLAYGIWIILLPKELFVTMVVWLMLVVVIFTSGIYRFINPYIMRIGEDKQMKQEIS